MNPKTWVTFAPDITWPSLATIADYEAFLDNPANGWIKGQAIPHPQFDDFAAFPQTYDVGLIILNTAAPINQFVALPPIGFLDTIAGGKGENQTNRFTVVGYGLQGYIKPFYGDTFSRYQATVRLIELNSTFDGGASAKFTNNPGQGGGTCYGDSGGPVLYGSSNIVTATVSFGYTPCIGVDYQFRIDTAVAQDFILAHLP